MNDRITTFADFVAYVMLQDGRGLLPHAYVSPRRIEQQRRAQKPAMTFGELQLELHRLRSWGIVPEQVKSAADLMGRK